MEIIIHRVNKTKELKKINHSYGVEIDIRSYNNKLILNHEPYDDGDDLESYLKEYKHGSLILNIKEAGIEKDVLKLVQNYSIKNYFFLDVEFPFILNSYYENIKDIAIRLSYYESFDHLNKFQGFFKWIWLDSYKFCNFSKEEIKILNKSKICFVCPSRWDKNKEILNYKKFFLDNKINIEAVMTDEENVKQWI